MIEYRTDQLRFEGGRPVAAGDQELRSPTTMVTTASGMWALFALGEHGVLVVHPGGAVAGPTGEVEARLAQLAGDDDQPGDDREAAGRLRTMLGGDDSDPRRGGEGSRSPTAETGLPPSYQLSGPRNLPAGHTETASGSADPGAPAP